MQSNMCAMINITDEDILFAEKVLLRDNQKFDDERIEFIRNFGTIDLQAVPGSGKTTTLLAKLLILEKYMPLKGNIGVLVISHTNAAVDEIRVRIGKFCPQLFNYPNFVGTIQSFVDTFLAIPFYINQFKAKPYRIDNEIYNEKVDKFLSNLWFHKYGLSNDTLRKIGYIKNVNESLFFNYRFDFDENKKLILTKLLNSEKLEINKPRGRTRSENYQDYSITEKKDLHKWFCYFKKEILKDEQVLHFDDAYFMANYYLIRFSKIRKLLQKRFGFVFVDEMQDMDTHQHNLLENIFYEDGNSTSVFQRIGDKNQAIFNGSAKLDNVWSLRENILNLNGSLRINSILAPVVERLALTANTIEGRNKNQDNTDIDIKPHIIVFNNETITEVIRTYAEIINNLQIEGKIPNPSVHKYMAVAWIKEHSDVDKIALSDYWDKYSIVGYSTQIDFKVLKDYLLFFDKEKRTLESVRKNILNAFLKIMRLENILNVDNRVYSKRKLLSYIKENNINEYENFKLQIYKWSIAIIQGKTENSLLSVQEYVPVFLEIFQKEIDKSTAFINGESEINIEEIEIVGQSNIYESDENRIEIGTIHSAKGQTHTATLYLESFFQGKYESEYLKNLFLNIPINSNGVYIKQVLKMSYVGFSRPTHLLCIAIHEDRFNSELSEIDRNNWEIVEIEPSS